MITIQVVVEQKEHRKHTYQVNYTREIRICCYFLRMKKARSDIEDLIGHELLPVRPGRTAPPQSQNWVGYKFSLQSSLTGTLYTIWVTDGIICLFMMQKYLKVFQKEEDNKQKCLLSSKIS